MQSLQLNRPHAIMMVGIPGSGKSFFAEQFAETFHAPYIDSLAIEERSRDGAAAGEIIAIVLGEVAKTGQTFIYEGNSDSRARRTEFARWARANNYQPLFVWVQTDNTTALKRTLKSGSLDENQFNAVLKDFSPPHPDEKAVVVSGRHTYASQARAVLTRLSKGTRPTSTPERTGGRITVR